MTSQLLASTSPEDSILAPISLICESCRRIDFGKALAVPPEALHDHATDGVLLDEDASRFVPPLHTECPLCRILSSTICWYHDYWSDPATQAGMSTKFSLYAFSYLRNSNWAPRGLGVEIPESRDSHLLLSIPQNMWTSNGDHSRGGNSDGELGYVVCFPPGSVEQGLFRPQPIPNRLDYLKARSWINDCRENHSHECNSVHPIIPNMRLIDCHNSEIVMADSTMQWVALSYVWGSQSRMNDTYISAGVVYNSPSLNCRLPSSISNTVKDAILVTTQLGFRYLWIDRYCINQQDSVDKALQIKFMDQIYRGAQVAIIAAAGDDENYGLPGVSDRARTKQEILRLDNCTILTTSPEPVSYVRKKSQWWTRGWTFQEGLLSRRRLIFTEYQMFFECNTTSWMEASGGIEHVSMPREIDWPKCRASPSLFRYLLPGPPNWRMSMNAELRLQHRYTDWFTAVMLYTNRNLSFDTDSLDAFTGIARLMQRASPPIFHISGLPIVISPENEGAPLFDMYLFASLCWYHSGRSTTRRRLCLPSWTWAGWAGSARWLAFPFSAHKGASPLLRDLKLEFRNGQVSSMAQHLLYGGLDAADYQLDEVVSFRFEAREVPSSMFKFNIRKKYLGVDSDDEFIEESGDEVMEEAENIPDPDDWAYWTVGVHRLCLKRMAVPLWTPKTLLGHLDDRSWSCLLLGDYRGTSLSHRRFLLVVEWQSGDIGTRIGALVVDQHYYMDQNYPQFFEEGELPWRAVCLT
ncbi:hypothetical protein CFAM422_003781 [Trichoderma lentiforme]|uniref:Heterokaryon incompatibility domain-containing protein n=1 Tax=Trichoderma lentiforme TaxID=1567552 RepID=A0A9P4XLU3_9HYPO|nr:hypothetical protein CFAM422_003781 [Trichoderma lentiforme]